MLWPIFMKVRHGEELFKVAKFHTKTLLTLVWVLPIMQQGLTFLNFAEAIYIAHSDFREIIFGLSVYFTYSEGSNNKIKACLLFSK